MEERKLNLAEKGKFEKIAREDIENGVLLYEAKRVEEKEKLRESLCKNPQAQIKRLAIGYHKALENKKSYEKELSEKGWEATSESTDHPYGVKPQTYNYNKRRDTHPELVAFREETDKVKKELQNLARKLIVGLYLSGTEAQKLLTEIGDAIKKALK